MFVHSVLNPIHIFLLFFTFEQTGGLKIPKPKEKEKQKEKQKEKKKEKKKKKKIPKKNQRKINKNNKQTRDRKKRLQRRNAGIASSPLPSNRYYPGDDKLAIPDFQDFIKKDETLEVPNVKTYKSCMCYTCLFLIYLKTL